MREDQLLIRQLRRGDAEALRSIYQRFKDEMLTVAVCFLGDGHAAEDCLHDVFVALARGARRLPEVRTLRSYLAACVANAARDRLRRRKTASEVALSETFDLPSPAEGALAELANRELSDAVGTAIASLPYEQREVVVLHLRGEMTFREIAERSGESINTIQSRYRYGLAVLRHVLELEGAR